VAVEIILFGDSGPRKESESEDVGADGRIRGLVRNSHFSKLLTAFENILNEFSACHREIDPCLLALEAEPVTVNMMLR
jgi:hypothetical protein